MEIKETEKKIERFLKKTKLQWQIIVLSTVFLYGITLIYRLTTHSTTKALSYLKALNLLSFVIALTLAFTIFHLKRKYFRLRFFRQYLEDLSLKVSEIQVKEAAQDLTTFIGQKLKTVWYMGGALILLGVIYYWWTYDAWNMHVYFIVGLYSLMINYPRRDLFIDLPYIIHETFKTEQKVQ